MKFAVGDKIAFYNGSVRRVGRLRLITNDGILTVAYGDYVWHLHPKQCRRVVRKSRRKLYAVVPSYGVSWVKAFYNEKDADAEKGRIDPLATLQVFVEARKEKKK